MKVVAGIDVGKSSLDVSVSAGPVRRFDNAPAGLSALVGWLEREGATHVVCESTGGYERAVVRRLRSTAWSVHIAHPNRVRHFARAAGPSQDRRAGRADAVAVWAGIRGA